MALFRNKRKPKRKATKGKTVFSRFMGEGADIELIKTLRQSVGLCSLGLTVARRKMGIAQKSAMAAERLEQLKRLTRLAQEDVDRFKKLQDSFAALDNERASLMKRMTGFDKSLSRLAKLENEAKTAVNELRDAERYKLALTRDIGYIEGEKADLEYERRSLMTGINFVSRLGAGITGLFVFGAVLLSVIAHVNRDNMLFLGVALCMLACVSGVILFSFRKRVAAELVMNGKKQARAVHLMNQKNVVFAAYNNLLNAAYKKYSVHNSRALESHLSEYQHYKTVTQRVDAVRASMYETGGAIERFMDENGIENNHSSLENFVKQIDLTNLEHAFDDLSQQKTAFSKQLDELDMKQGAIWDLLQRIKIERPQYSDSMDEVIQTYMDEMGRLLASPDDER
ncbi:MAG: hypothetical protein LBL96_09900 [Clostridiales bacterium]|jgi:predicted  nucleic acid-binding Zn-ribbon protein|nr:hypothetical protein [Clostridiales bacterium]